MSVERRARLHQPAHHVAGSAAMRPSIALHALYLKRYKKQMPDPEWWRIIFLFRSKANVSEWRYVKTHLYSQKRLKRNMDNRIANNTQWKQNMLFAGAAIWFDACFAPILKSISISVSTFTMMSSFKPERGKKNGSWSMICSCQIWHFSKENMSGTWIPDIMAIYY